MNIPKNISKKPILAIIFGTLFCLLFVSETMAQSDKERLDREQVKTSGNFYSEVEKQEVNGRIYEVQPSKVNPSSEKVIRDSSGYRVEEQREVKEEGKSTLSFNIFLYVLDRFKEN